MGGAIRPEPSGTRLVSEHSTYELPVPRHLDADLAADLGQHRLSAGAVAHVAARAGDRAVLLMAQVPSSPGPARSPGPSWSATGPAPGPGAPAPQRSFSSAVGSRLAFFVTSSSVTSITAPLPPNLRLSDQRRKHRCCQGSPTKVAKDPPGGAGGRLSTRSLLITRLCLERPSGTPKCGIWTGCSPDSGQCAVEEDHRPLRAVMRPVAAAVASAW
jgi:hypothetical protein